MERVLNVAILLLVATIANGARNQQQSRKEKEEYAAADDGQISEDCPEPNGFFADAEQCDKYYQCVDGVLTEKLCPDGLIFNDFNVQYEKCDLPFGIDCTQRSKLQPPQRSINCPRKNGYFAHEDRHVCNKFNYCVDGTFNMLTCPNDLVYNENVGICSWPDEAKRKGCSTAELFEFDCPKVDEAFGLTHPRYADSKDCQFFYVCINGNVPRRNGCKLGQAFDDTTKTCNWARKIPECADWYKGRLTDEQLDALENPPKPKSSSGGRRKHPRKLSIEVPAEI